MKILTNKMIENYSSQPNTNDIGGSLIKNFVRVDSEFIVRYFDEISKPNSSYVSYSDDLIRECYNPMFRDENGKKSLPLKYFSVLIKSTDKHSYNCDGTRHEVLGSRLANLFGIPTVYNLVFKYKDNTNYIMSLDFLKNGETLENFEQLVLDNFVGSWTKHSLDMTFNEFQSLDMWCTLIEKTLYKIMDVNTPNLNKMIDDVCGDFCIQMLFRNLIVGDEDLLPHNFAFVFSEDKKSVKLSPAFDFEYCGSISFSLSFLYDLCNKYFKFIHERYPQKLAKFMDNLNKKCFYPDGEFKLTHLNKCVNEVDAENYWKTEYINKLKSNLTRLNFAYDRISSDWNKHLDEDKLAEEYKNEFIK